MKSTSTIFCLKQQKLDSGEAIYIFLKFHLFIFFSSSSSFNGFVFNMTTTNTFNIKTRFSSDLFVFVETNYLFVMVPYVFCKDLMVCFVHLIFQVYTRLKWRVQPHTSFWTTKKSSMAILYLFFWAFCRSYSCVLLLSILLHVKFNFFEFFLWFHINFFYYFNPILF